MEFYGLRNMTFVLLFCVALSGCATHDSGYRITKETTAFVQPGVTTRAELVENLGPPLLELKDPHVLAYSWGKVRGKAVSRPVGQDPSMVPGGSLNQPTYSAGPAPLEEIGTVEAGRWIYCVALDNQDRVSRAETVKFEKQPSLEQAVRQWGKAAATP